MILLAILGTALALDVEPNDSCGSESLGVAVVGEGSIGSSSDTDHFDLGPLNAGTLQLRLENLGNPDEDFTLALYNATGTFLFTSAAESGGVVELSRTVTTPASFCLEVGGSEGSYRLSTDFLYNAPVITDVQDTSGNTITSASIGDVIEIHGANFGASAQDVRVTFNGARANIVSHSPMELDVRVPANASDGDLYVKSAGRRSAAYSFSVGVSATPTTTYPPAGTTVLSVPDGSHFYVGRTIVSFDPDADASDITTALDAVLAADSNLTAYTISGELPAVNIAVVDWTMTSTGVQDHKNLVTGLIAESEVTGVDMDHVLRQQELATPSDFDFLQDSSSNTGAFHQVGYEEARRLFEYSGLAGLADVARVVILDTGLARGPAWTASSYDEFPSATFELRESDGSAWSTTTTSNGHFTEVSSCPGDPLPVNHGNLLMSVWGAENQKEPDWEDGAARSGDNACGILGGFQLFGIDDDGDALFDRDDDTEAIERSAVMFNDRGTSVDATDRGVDTIIDAMQAVAADSSLDHVPVVIAGGFPRWQWLYYYYLKGSRGLKEAARDLCTDRIVVISAGNGQCGALGAENGNYLAEVLTDACPDTTIVVGGTVAGSDDVATDQWFNATHYGSMVNLLAPAMGYRVATVPNDNTWTSGIYKSNVKGTSPAAPLVGAAVSLFRAIVGEGTISDALLVSLLQSTGDDISEAYTQTTGSTMRLNLHRVVERALGLAGASPMVYQAPRLYAVDYSNNRLLSEQVDPSDGTLTTPVVTATTSTDGCYSPTDVEVHPLGDVVYVLCAGTAGNAKNRSLHRR